MTLQFSGVILDMDGLLLDTERLQYEVGPEVLRGMGHELEPEFFKTLVGIDRAESARLIGLEIGIALDAVELDRAWNSAMDEKMRDAIPLRPGVNELFDALDESAVPRAIATNSATARAKWKLEHAGLLQRIDAVIGVDMVKHGKPAPDFYLAAADAIGLMLGVRAAFDAGIGMVIQVPDLVMSRELRAHHQVASLDDARVLLRI